ncbi:HNH endonuclease [Clostridium perfringens]
MRASKYYEECILKGLDEEEKTREEVTATLLKTEYEKLIKTRVGQGNFKNKLLKRKACCKICGMNDSSLLIASHIKPWSKSNSFERLDESNGFLLCPNHDALFDKGYITFNNIGKIIISSKIDKNNYKLLGVNDEIYINIAQSNIKYLNWHRLHVFKE